MFLEYADLKGKGVKFSRMHIDRLEKDGLFPRRVHLGRRSVAWVETEIDAYNKNIVAQRDEKLAAFIPDLAA